MRIFHVLEKIENAIYHSRKIPWSDYVLVKKDKILNLIEKTRQSLPKDMKQARWVTMEKQRIEKDAQQKATQVVHESERRAQELLKQAEEEKKKILDQEEIVILAKERAGKIVFDAEQEAKDMVQEARLKSEQLEKNARNKALSITMKAREDAEMTREGADSYALKILSGMEGEFSRILSIIQKSKKAMLDSMESKPSPKSQPQRVSPPPAESSTEKISPASPPKQSPPSEAQGNTSSHKTTEIHNIPQGKSERKMTLKPQHGIQRRDMEELKEAAREKQRALQEPNRE
ncbi:MAG: hypothetical protein ACLFQV_05675 [Vulcanimicrobiota bacterium]